MPSKAMTTEVMDDEGILDVQTNSMKISLQNNMRLCAEPAEND